MFQTNKKSALASILISSLSSLIFGITLTMTKAIKIAADASTLKKSLVVSSVFFGALIGTLIAPRVFNSLKNTIILANFLYLLGSIILRSFEDVNILIIGRLVIGLGVGMICVAVPIYLSELAPKNIKNLVGSSHQLGIVIGLLLGQVMSYFSNDTSYKQLLTTYVALIGIVLILSTFIREIETQSSSYGYRKLFEIEGEKEKLVTSILLHILQQASCINGVISYSHMIFEGNPSLNPGLCTIYMGVVSLVTTILSMAFVEEFGNICLLYLSKTILVSSLMSLAFNYEIMISIFIFMAGFNIGIGPVPWIYIGKIFQKETRKAGVSIAVSVNWLSGFIVTLMFPILIKQQLFCYLGFGALTAILTIVVTRRMKNK